MGAVTNDIEPVQRQFGRTAAAYVESATHARGEDLAPQGVAVIEAC